MKKMLMLVLVFVSLAVYSQRVIGFTILWQEGVKREAGNIIVALSDIEREYKEYVRFDLVGLGKADLVIKVCREGYVREHYGYDGLQRGNLIMLDKGAGVALLHHELGHWLGYDHDYGRINPVMNGVVEADSRLRYVEWYTFWLYGLLR